MNYTDSRRHLFVNPTPLSQIFILRRSYRKYSTKDVAPEIINEIEKTANLFILKLNLNHSYLIITRTRDELVAVIEAATEGFSGKINPWLKNTNAKHIIIAITNMNEANEAPERLKRIAETSMLMEIAILRATELGLATCWMAGINTFEIENYYNLRSEEEVIAISTLGYPPENSSIVDYDFWANRLVSVRRKDISELVFYDEIR